MTSQTKISFMNGFEIKIKQVPKYACWKGDWVEQLDKPLARMLCESMDPRLTDAMKGLFFEKIYARMNDNGINKVKWSAPYGLGRHYPSQDFPVGSITFHSKYIKNTMFAYLGWRDLDMVKGHPTILYEFCKNLPVPRLLPAFECYLQNFETTAWQELAEHYQKVDQPVVTQGDIKDLFNSTIYGGGHNAWVAKMLKGDEKKGKKPKEVNSAEHPLYTGFKQDCVAVADSIWEHNQELYDKVKGDGLNKFKQPMSLWEKKSRTMSFWCGIVENEILKHSYDYNCKNGLLKERTAGLSMDGFTQPPFLAAYTDEEFHLNGLNDYIREKTGLAVKMIWKPFKPDTILQEVIDQRRAIPQAQVVQDLEVVGSEVNEAHPESYLNWKTDFELTHCKIINTANFMKKVLEDNGEFNRYAFFSSKDLKTAYEHCRYIETNDQGKTKNSACIDTWLKDPEIRKYDRVDMYPPPLVCPDNVFNIWVDSPLKDKWIDADDRLDEEELAKANLIMDHIQKIICDQREPEFRYLMGWIAQLIQNPADKKVPAITLISLMGAGKNILTWFISLLIGNEKSYTTAAPEKYIYGKFNGIVANKIFINLDEVDKRNGYGNDGVIKNMQTFEKWTINEKMEKPYECTSYHRFMATTNNPDPVIALTEDNRRDLILKCSNDKVEKNEENQKYFDDLVAAIRTQRVMEYLYNYFASYDLEHFGWNAKIVPKTEYQQILVKHNVSPLDTFLEWFVWRNKSKDSITVFGSEMYDELKTWKTDTGYDYKCTDAGDLMKKLRLNMYYPEKSFEKSLTRSNKGNKSIINLVKLREYFKIDSECLIQIAHDEQVEITAAATAAAVAAAALQQEIHNAIPIAPPAPKPPVPAVFRKKKNAVVSCAGGGTDEEF